MAVMVYGRHEETAVSGSGMRQIDTNLSIVCRTFFLGQRKGGNGVGSAENGTERRSEVGCQTDAELFLGQVRYAGQLVPDRIRLLAEALL